VLDTDYLVEPGKDFVSSKDFGQYRLVLWVLSSGSPGVVTYFDQD
jgi:hypothetical protein